MTVTIRPAILALLLTAFIAFCAMVWRITTPPDFGYQARQENRA